MNIVYRKATTSDLILITDLVQGVIIEMEKFNIFQWDSMYPTKEDFKIDIESHSAYIGTLDENIVVVFVLNKKSDKEYDEGNWKEPIKPYYVLHRLFVNPLYQNMGVAKKTLSFIENEVKSLECAAIRLDVFCENPFALKLYDGFKYEKVGIVDFRKGRFYLMEKYL